MARKINVRKILDELIKKTSHNSIASSWHISKHSVSDVAARGLELGILPEGPVSENGRLLVQAVLPEKRSLRKRVMSRWTLRRSSKSSITQEPHSSYCGKNTRSNASAMARLQ